MTSPNQPWPQQPTGPQHGGPQRSWPARHKALTVLLAVVGLFVVIGAIGAAAGGGSTKTVTQPGPTVTVTETEPGPTVTAQSAAPSPSATPQQATAHTVATFSGSGQQNTAKFTVTGTWKLKYSFDCSAFGQSGNFQVYEDGGIGSALSVNDLAKAKSASTLAYDDAGTHYLQVNSECSWTMKVIDEPGQ
jgi:hypothetical protein